LRSIHSTNRMRVLPLGRHDRFAESWLVIRLSHLLRVEAREELRARSRGRAKWTAAGKVRQ
jgi:hypothetical protein